MPNPDPLLGCLIGTAIGYSVGLPREGLSRARATALFGKPPLRQSLVFGKGMCSDDTEHAILTLLALRRSNNNTAQFKAKLAWSLRWWIARLPAGTGMATLKACIKLWLPIVKRASAINSAGAGPAMRSAVIGLAITDQNAMTEHVIASTKLTHADPKAIAGSLCLAHAAQLASSSTPELYPTDLIETLLDRLSAHLGDEMRSNLRLIATMLEANASPQDFANAIGQPKGISGYINHVVPAALYCWLHHPTDFRRTIEASVSLGGDTDTVAAIAGALAGTRLGTDSIPDDWMTNLSEWPCNIAWMTRLANDPSPPSLPWFNIIPRNIVFLAIILAHGFRRLAPPYR